MRKPERDPARAALAGAIANRNHRRSILDAARAGVERAEAAVETAWDTHARAEAALAAARADAVTRIAQDGGAPSALRSLRQAEVDATDDLEIAREALVQAQAAAEEAQRQADHADRLLGQAVDVVLYSDVARHEKAVIELARAKLGAVCAYEFVARAGSTAAPDEWRRHSYFASYNNQTATIEGAAEIIASATAPWATAREALMADPDAPLPA